MNEAKPMTVEERATKFHEDSGCECQAQGREDHIEWFAEQIQKACDEAKREAIIEFCEGDRSKLAEFEQKAYVKGYHEGFADGSIDMREKAVKVLDKQDAYCADYCISGESCNCLEIADKGIRALSPTKG